MGKLASSTRVDYCGAHIIANWPPIYIGKESGKHWEEGEDLSLLEFKTIEYKRKGYAIASDEQLAIITKVPKREFMRRGTNQHTNGENLLESTGARDQVGGLIKGSRTVVEAIVRRDSRGGLREFR